MAIRRLGRVFAATSMAAFLVACGGDGGGDEQRPPQQGDSAEGLWVGETSMGDQMAIFVLEDGATWGVVTQTDGAADVLVSTLHGQTSWSNGTLQGSGTEFDVRFGPISANYTGTYEPGNWLEGQVNTEADAEPIEFSGHYAPQYDQPASLAALAGTYEGQVATTASPDEDIRFTIAESGAISAADSEFCTGTGHATPHNDKNIFDLWISFVGVGCALENEARVEGVAYLEDGNLIAMGVNPSSQREGFFLTGKQILDDAMQ